MDATMRTVERVAAATGDVTDRARLGAERARMGRAGFEAAAAAWLVAAQAAVDTTYNQPGKTFNRRVLSFEPGRRYWRVVATTDGQRSAFAFLDTTNGDVLKPDGWKRPAKHARGNVFDPANGAAAVGPYGPAYLR